MFNTGIGGFKVPFTVPKGTTQKKKTTANAAPFVYPGIGREFTAEEQAVFPQYTAPIADVAQIAPAVDPAAAAAAAKKAEDAAKLGKYKGQGKTTLDEMSALYDELMGLVRKTGADQSSRINKNYDGKVTEQVDGMNNGMYDVDVSAAASNLGDSSFRSFDRTKVRKASEGNIKTLNDGRNSDLATLGKQVNGEVAKYEADKNGIGLTRELLEGSEDLNEVTGTVSKLSSTKNGLIGNKANYGTEGEFVQSAAKLGNYDTTNLEATLQSVIANAAASPASKQATINDLLNGTPLDEKKKNELKGKYTQVIG